MSYGKDASKNGSAPLKQGKSFIRQACYYWACSSGILAVLLAGLAAKYQSELQQFRDGETGFKWVNWIGEYACPDTVAIERPQTLETLADTVSKHTSVRAVATGHSFNPFVCPASNTGAVVDMRAFRKVEVVKTSSSSSGYAVRAQAGIKMGQLQNEILARGLTLRVPPGNPAYTLGGCIATGCHNLGQSHAQDLLAVSVVLHNGTVREIKRGEADFQAAAVSLGRLGIILSATLEALPYRSLQWSAEAFPIPGSSEIISKLKNMSKKQTSQETVGNKLVFYLATDVMMMEHWVPTGRAAELQEVGEPLKPYINPQPFRVGQSPMTRSYMAVRDTVFQFTPKWWLSLMQIPAETLFRGIHSSPALSKVRKALGWQHSPEARGEASVRPTGNQYTWAGFVDEVMNLMMGLRHVEVIFPLYPEDKAIKCLDAVFAHRHLAWWRLNIRTQQSESFFISSTHAPVGTKPIPYLRVDFVSPGGLLDKEDGEASLTTLLRSECPGWRKHWGKGLFATSSQDAWGEPEAFLEVAQRWDPEGKFKPAATPSWLP